MWKPNSRPADMPFAAADKNQVSTVQPQSVAPKSPAPPPQPQSGQAVIGKSIVIKGEITGSEALHIHGRVEGPIDVGANYLHIGAGATVVSDIKAGELVVRGTVRGNVILSDRLDVRTGGSLVGDVDAKRIIVEDGAHFKGNIDMHGPEQKPSAAMPFGQKKESGSVSVSGEKSFGTVAG
jgi:cytoskeletal protein CcmA (bactofilin family)